MATTETVSPEEVRLNWQPTRFSPRIGGRYDMVVAALRIVLPVAAVAVLLATLAYPFFEAQETSFVLSRDRIEASEDRLRMINPRYSGVDARERPFLVRAESAVQPRGVADAVTLTAIRATMTLDDAEKVDIQADDGVYRTSAETLALTGPVMMTTTAGYKIDARDAIVDLDDHLVRSDAPVEADGPLGRFSAQGFESAIDQDSLVFTGGVKARIDPKRARLPVPMLGDDDVAKQ